MILRRSLGEHPASAAYPAFPREDPIPMAGNQWLERRPHARRIPRVDCRMGMAIVALALATGSGLAADSSLDSSVGFEYYAAPGHQLTRTVVGALEAKRAGGSVSLSLGRFDDSGMGRGVTLGGGLGIPLAPRTQLKLGAERSLGDSGSRAWVLKAGPAIRLLRGQTLSLIYVHSEDGDGTNSNGASVELEAPIVVDRLSASASACYVRMQDTGGAEGTAGLSWSPVDHLELEGEAGYTQTGIGLRGLVPGQHLAGHGRGQAKKSGSTTTSTSGIEKFPGATAQLAVRFSFP